MCSSDLSEAFSRAKEKNRNAIEQLRKAGRLRVLMESNVKGIAKEKVLVERKGKSLELPNDAVIVCAGGILPTPFLKSLGIRIETKYGTA